MRGALHFSRNSLHRLPRIPLPKPRSESKSNPTPSKAPDALLPSIEQFLTVTPDPQRVTGFVHGKLNQVIPTASSPHAVYERVIDFLLRKRCPQEATSVYKRLHDAKFVSSNKIDAQMIAVALSFPHEDPQPLIDRLMAIVGEPGFTEKNLFSLVQTMSSYDVDKNLAAVFVETFRVIRGPDYNPIPQVLAPLVASSARLGYLDEAFQLLERATKKPRSRAARQFIYVAYVSLLSTLRETRTWDSHSFNKVIDLMTARKLPLEISVFNILLSKEVRWGNPQNALAMYSMLKEMDVISPDAFTYGTLFALYRTIRPKAMRRYYTPDSTHMIPPRRLYREFLEATQRRRHRITMTTSLLNTAVRAFIRQRDYAGLFVVLRSFSLHDVPLDQRTYYSVMKHIVSRIWIEVTSKRHISQHEVKWSDRFLGVGFNEIKLSEDLVDHILFLVSRDEFELASPLHPLGEPSKYDDHGKYKIPTMQMMQSVDTPDPQDFKYEVTPLKRLIRRAILANLTETSKGAVGVSAAVVFAKQEMLPS